MGRRLSTLAFAMLLAACGGPIETRVSSTGTGITEAQAILLEESPTKGPAADARANVIAMLAQRGWSESAEGRLQLQVAVSERDASIALSTASGNTKKEIAPAKRNKPFQNCADREFRLSVLLTRISDGVQVYRGDAAEYHCKAQLADTLPVLSEKALADLAAPRGSYVTNRSGLD